MTEKNIVIDGMSCHHCAMAVRKQLEKIDGLTVHDVKTGQAQIQYDDSKINEQIIREAIAEAGYTLVSI